MKTNRWDELVRLARQAPPETEAESAPWGFSGRVVARAWEGRPDWVTRMAWKAVAVATLVTALVVALNVGQVNRVLDDDITALSEALLDDELSDWS